MRSQLLPSVAVLPPGSERRNDLRKIIDLDLGIGSSADAYERGVKRNLKIKQEIEEPLFSGAQFQELYNQIIVYNFIASGFPAAFHLLLPVFNSLGPDIYKKYPSFAEFSPHKPDCSSVMDSEPGRCLRTDGRKWRCSKNVIPQQKYCERHMHRGRQGSRKHVEPIRSFLMPDNMASVHTKMPVMPSVTSDMDDKTTISSSFQSDIVMPSVTSDMDDKTTISSSFQSDIAPTPPCSNYRIGVPAIVNYRGDENRDAKRTNAHAFTFGDKVNKNINVGYATSTSSSSKNNFATNGGNPRRIENWKRRGARNSCVGFVSSRFGSSPKSVLPSATGKVIQGAGNKNAIETEPQRCRRTDGKKWQCRRDALPNQKYCESHMHRGSKKLVLTPQSLNSSRINLDNGINLNTMPTSPHGNNSTSSTSDATTITD